MEVKVIKLKSGEEVIAQVESATDSSCDIVNPVFLQQISEKEIRMVGWLQSSAGNSSSTNEKTDRKFTFSYDTTYQMPPRGSYAHDFLGYNNGSFNASITTPMPKYYLWM